MKRIVDMLERVGSTALQVFLGMLLAGPRLNLSAAAAAGLAGVAAGLNAIRALIFVDSAGPRGWLEDLAIRSVWTYAYTLVSALVLSDVLNLSALQAAAAAALPAVLAAIKAVLARHFGSTDTASLLREPVPPAEPLPVGGTAAA